MNRNEITAEHCGARIAQVLEELESLRLEMGCSKDARVPMHVHDASPREVFYHAQTVHRKANQLCIELGAQAVNPPGAAEPARAIPADVLLVLDSTRERLATARASLHLEGDSRAPDLPGPLLTSAGKEPSDVLKGCLLASRQLNAMLGHAFAAPESQEQLLRALGLLGRLLAFHGAAMPALPAMERRKSPRDVFEVLWQSCRTLHQIMTDSDVPSLGIERGYVGEQPTDVYDMASLIVSELEFLASFLGGDAAAVPVTAVPPPVLPAHNFRHACQLRAAIAALAVLVRAKPDWLRSRG